MRDWKSDLQGPELHLNGTIACEARGIRHPAPYGACTTPTQGGWMLPGCGNCDCFMVEVGSMVVGHGDNY